MIVGPHYQGPLDQYLYKNPEIGDLLAFLRNCKNPKSTWLGDNLIWPNKVPEPIYDTYIFGFFGENFDYHYLEEVDSKLAGKKIIVLTSCPDTSRFDLKNVQTFYLEHLHRYLLLYPKTPVNLLADRACDFSLLSGVTRHHRLLVLAKLLSISTDSIYSFDSHTISQQCDRENFYTTMGSIIMNTYVPDSIKDTVDLLLDGKLDKAIPQDRKIGSWGIDNPAYTNAKFNISTETAYYSHPKNVWQYLTEKTFKCLVSGTPFVVVGQKNSHQRLLDLGFEIAYKSEILSFDSAEDSDRIYKIFDFLDTLVGNLNINHLQEITDFNYNYVYTDFYNKCIKTNQAQEEKILDFINH